MTVEWIDFYPNLCDFFFDWVCLLCTVHVRRQHMCMHINTSLWILCLNAFFGQHCFGFSMCAHFFVVISGFGGDGFILLNDFWSIWNSFACNLKRSVGCRPTFTKNVECFLLRLFTSTILLTWAIGFRCQTKNNNMFQKWTVRPCLWL